MIQPAAAVRVIHRHQIGSRVFARVSELTYVDGRPVAVLSWIHEGKGRLPGFFVALDDAKLCRGPNRRIFTYAGVTVDPRFPPRPLSG